MIVDELSDLKTRINSPLGDLVALAMTPSADMTPVLESPKAGKP